MTVYEARDGYVWDFREPYYQFNYETMQMEQIHLYGKTLYVGNGDTINNYIEVEEVTEDVPTI